MGGSSSSLTFNYDAHLFANTTQQSVEVKGDGEAKGETLPRRRIDRPELTKYPHEKDEKGGLKTLWEAFQYGVTKHPNNPMFGTRIYETEEKTGEAGTTLVYKRGADNDIIRGKYIWETYKQIDEKARAFGSGLVELGAKDKDNIGIWAVNRAEWVTGQLGLYSQNMRCVSLYATLGENAVDYILNHAEIAVVLTEKENVKKLLSYAHKIKSLKTIIQFDYQEIYNNVQDTVSAEDMKAAEEAGVKLLGFTDVIKLGEQKTHFPVLPTEEDFAFIMYTSGTTGTPKGALLRHANVMATVSAVPVVYPFKETDLHISFLPLAHIFETAVQATFWSVGAAIGFFQGNVKKLTNDFVDLRPTFLAGVPRVFSRVYQKVFAGVGEKNCIAQWYFNKAYNGQVEAIRNSRPREPKYDEKVFIPLRTRIGLDRCKLILSGAAPCPPYLQEFLKVVTGAAVVQGYGLTETSAATSITSPTDNTVGHVGAPFSCNEIKLRDVPEMDYRSTDKPHPRGEILLRGANVFAGYYKNEQATAEALDNGWLCTGDVGRWNPNGTLSIIDRKKNIFKLSQGEYIAAEKIEAVYSKSPVIGQIWVYGNSFKSTVLAVVVPQAEVISAYALEKGWWPSPKEQTQPGTPKFAEDFRTLFEGPHKDELKQHIFTTMSAENKHLKGFEKVIDILIEHRIDAMMQGFTEANDCLTPTFKLRRPYLLNRYIKELRELYAKHGEPDKPGEKWPGEGSL